MRRGRALGGVPAVFQCVRVLGWHHLLCSARGRLRRCGRRAVEGRSTGAGCVRRQAPGTRLRPPRALRPAAGPWVRAVAMSWAALRAAGPGYGAVSRWRVRG